MTFFRGEYNDEQNKFDAMVTYSSLEHSGLGRYFDNLNPWGDLITMAKVWCITKDSGQILVGVPSAKTDKLLMNAHRIYGKVQLAHLFANWKVIATNNKNLRVNVDSSDQDLDDYSGVYQPVYIAEKMKH